MNGRPDTSNAVIRPPIAWVLAFAVGLGLDWLYPLPFMPASPLRVWCGVAVFGTGLVIALWAIVMISRAGSHVETVKPTTSIVTAGPYRFTRNPIYLGMLFGQIGLAIAFDSLWLLATMLPFYWVLRYGVIAREEVYLERKFGADYLSFKSRVRRWL